MKRILLPGDLVALVVFALLGLARHDSGTSLEALGRTLGPLLVSWAVVSLVLGTYRRDARLVTVVTWFAAVTLSAVIRRLWLGHPRGMAFVTFLAVTLAVTGVLLGGWRLLASRVLAKRFADRGPQPERL